MPGDPGAGTSSYWVMPSNTATNISTIFRDRVITELIYLLISAAMVSMMFRRLIWIHFFYHFLAIRLYHEFLSQLNCHFSNITYFRQQQQQNKPMRYYEILPTHTETPRYTTRKIANLYIEFNYHFLTLQKKSHYFWTEVYICRNPINQTKTKKQFLWNLSLVALEVFILTSSGATHNR